MSKEEFIEHMSAFLYRVHDKKTREMLEVALTRYEDDRPSLDDEARLAEVEALREKANMVEGSVEWSPAVLRQTKSVDQVVQEIAHGNHGIVRRKDGLD